MPSQIKKEVREGSNYGTEAVGAVAGRSHSNSLDMVCLAWDELEFLFVSVHSHSSNNPVRNPVQHFGHPCQQGKEIETYFPMPSYEVPPDLLRHQLHGAAQELILFPREKAFAFPHGVSVLWTSEGGRLLHWRDICNSGSHCIFCRCVYMLSLSCLNYNAGLHWELW